MKISRYTKFISDINNNGNYFVYNSLSNFFAQIDKDLYLLLLAKQKKGNFVTEDELDKESRELLINKIILTENDDDDILKYISVVKNRRNVTNPLLLTIAPTMECNFSCPYCFETKENGKMDENTIDNIVNFVKKQRYLDSVSITWFGGEPLLYPDIMEIVTERMKKICKIPVKSKIITNGYFLNRKNIELLEKINVSDIQLTIDGMAETHNKIKFTENDKFTFETIINNIDTFSKQSTNTNLVIRVNIDKNNIEDFNDLSIFLTNRYRFSKNIFLAPSFIIQNTKNACKDSCLISNIEKFSIIKDFTKIMNNADLIYPNNSITECSARNPSTWVIDPSGGLYKCWEIIGNRKYKIGELTKDGIKISNTTQLNRYLYGADPFEDQSCNQCFSLPICGGGCPHKRIENKFKNSKYEICTYFEKNLDNYLLLRNNY